MSGGNGNYSWFYARKTEHDIPPYFLQRLQVPAIDYFILFAKISCSNIVLNFLLHPCLFSGNTFCQSPSKCLCSSRKTKNGTVCCFSFCLLPLSRHFPPPPAWRVTTIIFIFPRVPVSIYHKNDACIIPFAFAHVKINDGNWKMSTASWTCVHPIQSVYFFLFWRWIPPFSLFVEYKRVGCRIINLDKSIFVCLCVDAFICWFCINRNSFGYRQIRLEGPSYAINKLDHIFSSQPLGSSSNCFWHVRISLHNT